MSKSIEDVSMKSLGEGKGGSAEKEVAGELKLLKERSRYLAACLRFNRKLEPIS